MGGVGDHGVEARQLGRHNVVAHPPDWRFDEWG
jgi:hypothetical protein